MHAQKPAAENFVGVYEVTDVCAGVVFAAVAIAPFLNRSEIVFIFCISYRYLTFHRHCRSVSGNAGRKNAVHHIYAPCNGLHEAIRTADAHKVARHLSRIVRLHNVKHAIHNLFRFADRQTADCKAAFA